MLTDTLVEGRGVSVDRDDVAGELLYDIRILLEMTYDGSWTEIDELTSHSHYEVHFLKDVGLSRHVQHVVLSQAYGSRPQSKTIKAPPRHGRQFRVDQRDILGGQRRDQLRC